MSSSILTYSAQMSAKLDVQGNVGGVKDNNTTDSECNINQRTFLLRNNAPGRQTYY